MARKPAAPPSARDALTVVVPLYNPGSDLPRRVAAWLNVLGELGRDWELLLVNDGSTDGTAAVPAKFGLPKNARVLSHATRRGYGACLRTAAAEARYPLFFHAALDYPYRPNDLRTLLERIEVKDEVTGQQPTLVSGCRTGRPAPFAWRVLGRAWRLFCRVALGLPLGAPPGWHGFRARAHSYFVWVVFGVPLVDPYSAFKLWRTEFVKRVPIQSDGDFAHVELVAKATFLTCVLDEVPLTPSPTPLPVLSSTYWFDLWEVFRDPDFGRPPAPVPAGRATPAPAP